MLGAPSEDTPAPCEPVFAVLAMQGRELLEDGVDAVVVAHDDDVPVLHHGRVAPRPQLLQPSLRKKNISTIGLLVSLLFKTA